MKLLLARDDIEIVSKTRGGWTPLSFAIENGHNEVVKLLLAQDKIERDFKDSEDQTLLSLVVGNRHEEVAELLLLGQSEKEGKIGFN